MEKNLLSKARAHLQERIDFYRCAHLLSEDVAKSMEQFFDSCMSVIEKQNFPIEKALPYFMHYIDLVKEQQENPCQFGHYYTQERSPKDLYDFGLGFIRPLIDYKHSTFTGWDLVEKINSQLIKGDNVILFGNHQTEPDPQILRIFLQERYPDLAEKMIFVAGDRVLRDPIAVPLSRGLNLLCIYSKRYLDTFSSKEEALFHNQKTMQIMCQLLKEGGKIIYVAPSGGRDRQNSLEKVEVAPFDSQSIEMFSLMGQRSGKPCHFYPLSLGTYPILPPPKTVVVSLGEERISQGGPIHIHFGEELDLKNLIPPEVTQKQEKRALQAKKIHEIVSKNYSRFPLSY